MREIFERATMEMVLELLQKFETGGSHYTSDLAKLLHKYRMPAKNIVSFLLEFSELTIKRINEEEEAEFRKMFREEMGMDPDE